MDYAWFLFGFKGRLNRARYLVVELVLLALWLLFWLTPFQFSSQSDALYWVAAIAMIWVNLAVTAKRLHDRSRSGWWAVAIFIVNRLSYVYYALFFGLAFGVDISVARQLLLVMLAVALSLLQTWVIIELFFLIGTDGTNRFGPDPTRSAPNTSIALRQEPCGVPDFLLQRAGPAPRS
jgi:uncharacterized membrane protein YhaH (DUF805 family)